MPRSASRARRIVGRVFQHAVLFYDVHRVLRTGIVLSTHRVRGTGIVLAENADPEEATVAFEVAIQRMEAHQRGGQVSLLKHDANHTAPRRVGLRQPLGSSAH